LTWRGDGNSPFCTLRRTLLTSRSSNGAFPVKREYSMAPRL
jgi:hypothetical protein